MIALDSLSLSLLCRSTLQKDKVTPMRNYKTPNDAAALRAKIARPSKLNMPIGTTGIVTSFVHGFLGVGGPNAFVSLCFEIAVSALHSGAQDDCARVQEEGDNSRRCSRRRHYNGR